MQYSIGARNPNALNPTALLAASKAQLVEIKQIYAAPEARDKGISLFILQNLEAKAHKVGMLAIRLETEQLVT
jgi:N-acetylglutamate synthase-like GNAT family acetyltransferase